MNKIRTRWKFIKTAVLLIVIVISLVLIANRDDRKQIYNRAIVLFNAGQYAEAEEQFSILGLYEDSITYSIEARKHIKYDGASESYANGQFREAWELFASLGDFGDSPEMALKSRYEYANELYRDGNLEEAFGIYQELNDYKDSSLQIANITLELKNKMEKRIYDAAVGYYNTEEYALAAQEFGKIEDYADSAELKLLCEKAFLRRKWGTTFSASPGIIGSAAIRENGDLLFTGSEMASQLAGFDGKELVSLSCHGRVSIGLKKDGTVITTDRFNGDTSQWSDIIAVKAGWSYVVGLKSDGSVVALGHNGDGQCNVQGEEWQNIVSIETGWRHTLGLTQDGTVKITGYTNGPDQKREVESWTDIIAIAAGGGNAEAPGRGHSVGLKADGHVVAAGDNSHGQCDVGDWEDIVAIAAGDWHTVGLKKDGRVVAVGYDETSNYERNAPSDACFVEDWENIVAIAAGTGYTLGLTADGKILAVGYYAQSQRPNSYEWDNILVYQEWDSITKQ